MENKDLIVIELFNSFITKSSSISTEKAFVEKCWIEFSELLKTKPFDYYKIYSFLAKLSSSEQSKAIVGDELKKISHTETQNLGISFETAIEKNPLDFKTIFQSIFCYMDSFDGIENVEIIPETTNYESKFILLAINKEESLFSSISLMLFIDISTMNSNLFRIAESGNTRFFKSREKIHSLAKIVRNLQLLQSTKEEILEISINEPILMKYFGDCLKELIYRFLEDLRVVEDQEALMKKLLIGNCQFSDQIIQIIVHVTKISVELHNLTVEGIDVFEFDSKDTTGKIVLFYDETLKKCFPIIPDNCFKSEFLELKKDLKTENHKFAIEVQKENIKEKQKVSFFHEKIQENGENFQSKYSSSFGNELHNIQTDLKEKESKIQFETQNKTRDTEKNWNKISNGVFEVDNSPFRKKSKIQDDTSFGIKENDLKANVVERNTSKISEKFKEFIDSPIIQINETNEMNKPEDHSKKYSRPTTPLTKENIKQSVNNEKLAALSRNFMKLMKSNSIQIQDGVMKEIKNDVIIVL